MESLSVETGHVVTTVVVTPLITVVTVVNWTGVEVSHGTVTIEVTVPETISVVV